MSVYIAVIQPEAERDLDEAFAYLENKQHGLGFDLLADLSDIIALLEDNPLLFQKVYGENRRAIIHRFGYNVIYKVMDSKIYILAIIHGSRNPLKWLGRK